MTTSLTLDTTRRDDGTLVLTAAGEIDLSNLDGFNQALTTATTEAASGGHGLPSTSPQSSTSTAQRSTRCTTSPTTSNSSPTPY